MAAARRATRVPFTPLHRYHSVTFSHIVLHQDAEIALEYKMLPGYCWNDSTTFICTVPCPAAGHLILKYLYGPRFGAWCFFADIFSNFPLRLGKEFEYPLIFVKGCLLSLSHWSHLN
jgi:hypothetical protein